jgi:hypothetical protein
LQARGDVLVDKDEDHGEAELLVPSVWRGDDHDVDMGKKGVQVLACGRKREEKREAVALKREKGR